MVIFPNCKINLGLRILRKREDGYHDLETIFYPVPLTDVLELLPATETRCILSGIPVPGDPAKNLCIKAWDLLKKDFPELPPVHIWLHKVIPIGAGMGGGSADGAFMLQLLNNRFRLQLTKEQLIRYALQLGSDCPFFMENAPCFAAGRGEQMTPLTLDLSNWYLTIVFPGIPVSTAWAFGQITPGVPAGPSLIEIVQQPVSEWKNQLVNDFENPVFAAWPEIAAVQEKLYAQGAAFSALSGSGSTVFALSAEPLDLNGLFPEHYLIRANLPLSPKN